MGEMPVTHHVAPLGRPSGTDLAILLKYTEHPCDVKEKGNHRSRWLSFTALRSISDAHMAIIGSFDGGRVIMAL